MTATELMEYVNNPTKIQVRQIGSAGSSIKVRVEPSLITRTANDFYAMALKHACNRLENNFAAGVDNATTLREFKAWALERGIDVDKQYIDEERV